MFGCIESEEKKKNENLHGKNVRKIYNLFCYVGVLKIIKLLRNVITLEFQTYKNEKEIKKKINYNIIIN